jgi:Zn-dependent metalloprotease
MKKVLLLLIMMGTTSLIWSQQKSSFKEVKRAHQPHLLDQVPQFDFSAFNGIPSAEDPFRSLYFSPGQIQPTPFSGVLQAGFKVKKDPVTGLPIMVKGKLRKANQPIGGKITWKSKSTQYLETLKSALQITDPGAEFQVVSVTEDELQHTHIRLQQYFGKLQVFGGEIILHAKDNSIYLMNGRYYPTPELKTESPKIKKDQAVELALSDVAKYTRVVDIPKNMRHMVAGPQATVELVVYHEKMRPDAERLAWKIQLVPNLSDRWSYFVDAQSGEIIDQYNQTCRFFHKEGMGHTHTHEAAPGLAETKTYSAPTLFDGSRTISGQDLNGTNRSINIYEIGSDYIMLDISQPMFDAGRSMIPQDVVGGIITLDAQNSSPQRDDFTTNYVATGNINSWDPNGVSAHFNSITSYNYFRNTFNRNSINGEGGTVYSIINVTDEDDADMDNAFWNGIAMFYGNGKDAFTQFAGSLDVGGHEMSHGVIQNSANLEYVSQSGALNESFADVFGVLIEREDWLLGEDIVNTQFFPSGALRDMSNPNNQGSGPGDFRWQPKDMTEFQNLDPTPEQDNGGVHINSGIPNRAFYLFATADGVTIEEAEQVYYRALTQYLTRTSQFIDMRIAAVQAATDLHGANSTEVNAVRAAFDAVGITDGQGTPEPQPVPVNTGDELILFSNEDNTSLFLFSTQGNEIVNPFQNIPGPLRPPSVTDDGTFILYVAEDNTVWGIELNWQTGSVNASQINDSPIWGNIAISKDGSRFAATTNDIRASIIVGDINSGTTQEFQLYNPTYTQGVTTGDVKFADVLQWDFTGQWIMYDALNNIPGTLFNDDIEYWDIGFIYVWDNLSNGFGNGFIQKMYAGLGEGISVGNPTFSKNSPNIIAFDTFDEVNGEYFVEAVNIQNYETSTLWNNLKLGVPNYGLDDSYLIFDAVNTNDESIIAAIPLADDKISSPPNAGATIFFENPGSFGLKWGIIFSNGVRNFNPTNVNEEVIAAHNIKVYPNPVDEAFTLEMELEESTDIQLEIFDLLGRRLKALDLGTQNGTVRQSIEVNELAPATYLMRMQVGKKVVTSKLVKR